MTYTLWCPSMDATQHFCAEPNPTAGVWDHIPTIAEIIQAATPDLQELTGTAYRQAIYGLTSEIFAPTTCHFDKIETDEFTGWPEHWYPYQRNRPHVRWLGGHFFHDSDAYPHIKRLYRCSIHGKKPNKITIRHPYTLQDQWAKIMGEKFTRVVLDRTVHEELVALTKERIDPDWPDTVNNHPWSIRQVNAWLPTRDPVRTSHHVW